MQKSGSKKIQKYENIEIQKNRNSKFPKKNKKMTL